MTVLEPLVGGGRTVLTASMGAPRLRDHGYVETEWRCSGSAVSYDAPSGCSPDGRWSLEVVAAAPFATRIVVRRPADAADCSSTVVVEWLNVSSGADAAPLYGFLAPELMRRGHVWVGVSAQWSGIVPAPPLVAVDGADPDRGKGGIRLQALQEADPQRYGSLSHPGDAYCYGMFTSTVDALAAPGNPVIGDLSPQRFLAVGESQSAYALTTYVNGVQPSTRRFDGFLIHSRGGPTMPLGEAGRGVDLEAGRDDPPMRIRTDLDAPVMVVETETDLMGHLRFLPARQDDGDRFRLWEVAGAAHADRSIVGEFEELLGCEDPVNRGQQRFVVRAALRRLEEWVLGDGVPPSAARIDVEDRDGAPRFVTDDVGNATGGVRTPCVDVAVEVLSGLAAPGSSRICQLFGRTLPASEDALRTRWAAVEDYLDEYASATEAVIAAGFALDEDRDELLADARPDLITW
ncbi:MAG: hypothetical protein JST64_08925 [Actinobacteria bacterium]|nr:hypothetical protein [Actinomycetota bacterium]